MNVHGKPWQTVAFSTQVPVHVYPPPGTGLQLLGGQQYGLLGFGQRSKENAATTSPSATAFNEIEDVP